MAAKLVSRKSKAGGEDGIDAKLSQLVEARDDEGEQEAFRRGVIENICGKMLQVGIDLKETETHTHRQTDIQRERDSWLEREQLQRYLPICVCLSSASS